MILDDAICLQGDYGVLMYSMEVLSNIHIVHVPSAVELIYRSIQSGVEGASNVTGASSG